MKVFKAIDAFHKQTMYQLFEQLTLKLLLLAKQKQAIVDTKMLLSEALQLVFDEQPHRLTALIECLEYPFDLSQHPLAQLLKSPFQYQASSAPLIVISNDALSVVKSAFERPLKQLEDQNHLKVIAQVGAIDATLAYQCASLSCIIAIKDIGNHCKYRFDLWGDTKTNPLSRYSDYLQTSIERYLEGVKLEMDKGLRSLAPLYAFDEDIKLHIQMQWLSAFFVNLERIMQIMLRQSTNYDSPYYQLYQDLNQERLYVSQKRIEAFGVLIDTEFPSLGELRSKLSLKRLSIGEELVQGLVVSFHPSHEPYLKDEQRHWQDSLPPEDAIRDSDELRNVHSYEYLRFIAQSITPKLACQSRVLQEVLRLCGQDSRYRGRAKAYGDLYTRFWDDLEANVAKNYGDKALKADVDALVVCAYENPNHSIERTYSVIKSSLLDVNQCSSDVEQRIKKRLKLKFGFTDINQTSPYKKDEMGERLNSLWSETYTPQRGTSQPAVLGFRHQHLLPGKALRLGTQAQRLDNLVSVSESFVRYVSLSGPYVYFNDLGVSNEFSAVFHPKAYYERSKEQEFSQALHECEMRLEGLYVVSLPSDKGYMDDAVVKETRRYLDADKVYQELKAMALHQGKTPRNDFWISNKTKRKLFGPPPMSEDDSDVFYDTLKEENKVNEMLDASFKALGIKPHQIISEAQRQALLFHFCKYEYTKFIVETIRPNRYNKSCKDGIDRARVHSLYFNLLFSIEHGLAMTQDEFECEMHAAAAQVKARGMNSHSQRLWNVLDLYIKAQQASAHPMLPSWLVEWRDANVPPSRVLLKKINDSMRQVSDSVSFISEAALEGIRKYLADYNEQGYQPWFFKVHGINRALFYNQLLDCAKDNEFASLVIVYALLSTENGSELKALVVQQLRASGDLPRFQEDTDPLLYLLEKMNLCADSLKGLNGCVEAIITAAERTSEPLKDASALEIPTLKDGHIKSRLESF